MGGKLSMLAEILNIERVAVCVDNVEAILPDTIEEVWTIMKKMKERE